MKFLTGLVFCLVLSVLARAMHFDGTLIKHNSKSSIKLTDSGKKISLFVVNPEIQDQIDRLKTSDFVSLDGVLNQEPASILVQSINFVGLKDLIGTWNGNDEFCYRFASFSNISIFNKDEKNKCIFSTGVTTLEFSYTINPATPNWLVLLSDNHDSYIMDLLIRSKSSVELSLYDPESGYILKEIKLNR